jgi:SAM-dependent methyltransferase
MTDDARRAALYRDFHESQHGQELEGTRVSAAKIYDILFEHVNPASVLDVGCGYGAWLEVARQKSVGDVRGIEGPWIEKAKLLIEPELVDIVDLEQGFSLGRRFDLIVCTEVAEHLSAAAAPKLIESLASHSDVVLFSAAIPFQGGHHHVNEQFADYWVEKFAGHGFAVCDLIRPRIWNDQTILWWLRQNMLLFAHERVFANVPALEAERRIDRIISIVHPEIYASRAVSWQRHEALVRLLATGGTFVVTMQNGRMNIVKK